MLSNKMRFNGLQRKKNRAHIMLYLGYLANDDNKNDNNIKIFTKFSIRHVAHRRVARYIT